MIPQLQGISEVQELGSVLSGVWRHAQLRSSLETVLLQELRPDIHVPAAARRQRATARQRVGRRAEETQTERVPELVAFKEVA